MAALTATIAQTGTGAADNVKFRKCIDQFKQIMDKYGVGYTIAVA